GARGGLGRRRRPAPRARRSARTSCTGRRGLRRGPRAAAGRARSSRRGPPVGRAVFHGRAPADLVGGRPLAGAPQGEDRRHGRAVSAAGVARLETPGGARPMRRRSRRPWYLPRRSRRSQRWAFAVVLLSLLAAFVVVQ